MSKDLLALSSFYFPKNINFISILQETTKDMSILFACSALNSTL
jgi:hypothetical protein